MRIDEIKDLHQLYEIGFRVGYSGTDSTTFPMYPPCKPEVRDAWMRGWKKGHESYLINLKHN